MMTTFLKKLLVLSLIYSVLACLINSLLYNQFPDRFQELESPLLVLKWNHVQKVESYKTIFVGSSLTYRQIDPLVFDSVVGEFGSPSFNLGQAGMLPTRSFKVADRLIDNPPDGLKFLILELNRLDYLSDNFSSPQVMFALDHAEYLFAARTILESELRFDKKGFYFLQYGRSYLYKYLGFGYLDLLLRQPSVTQLEKNRQLWRLQPQGFLSKDDQLSLGIDANAMTADRKRFLADTTVAAKNKLMVEKHYQAPSEYGGTTYLSRLRSIIALANQKGISVLFVMPPKGSAVTYTLTLPVFNQLPQQNRLDMADPFTYPQFYSQEFSYDKIHLNDHGAKFYSEQLALQFKDKLFRNESYLDSTDIILSVQKP